ncbi:unnamed protein product [Scytosiphon promiscuus]
MPRFPALIDRSYLATATHGRNEMPDQTNHGCSQKRAISALVKHAKATFVKNTDGTGLVAPISPSPQELIHSVYDNVGLGPCDVVLDLGCGDGRWLLAAARRGCAGRGVDLNEALLQKGRILAAEAGVSSLVKLEKEDIFKAPLTGSTLIIVYLFREGIAKMKDRLEEKADRCARVVSVGFRINGWIPRTTLVAEGLHAYIYNIPDRRASSGGTGGGLSDP